jgi:hypothetical protein
MISDCRPKVRPADGLPIGGPIDNSRQEKPTPLQILMREVTLCPFPIPQLAGATSSAHLRNRLTH